jgi:hypothetical protein
MVNTVRRPSLSAVPGASGLVLAIQANCSRGSSVSLSGFFHSAHRASLSALIAPRAARLRLLPRAATRAMLQAIRRWLVHRRHG